MDANYIPPQLDKPMLVRPIDRKQRRKELVEKVIWTHGMDLLPARIEIRQGFASDGFTLPPRNLTITAGLLLGFLLSLLLTLLAGFTATESVVTSFLGGLGLGLVAAWILGDPWGRGFEAAVVHDRICSGHGIRWEDPDTGAPLTDKQRSKANDRAFKRMMQAYRVGFIRSTIYFYAVRVFKPLVCILVKRGWMEW